MTVAKMKYTYFTAVMANERQFLILIEQISVSTNSRKTKTTTYGTCRRQIAKMVSRSLILFPVYKRHFVFFTVIIISVSDIRLLDWAPPKM